MVHKNSTYKQFQYIKVLEKTETRQLHLGSYLLFVEDFLFHFDHCQNKT